MDEKHVSAAIAQARRAAENVHDFRSETFAAVLLAALLRPDGVPMSMPAEEASRGRQDAAAQSLKPLSPSEYFASIEWHTEVDKVLLAGAFLERHSSVPKYGVQQIRTCILAAKVPLPKNVNLALFQAVQRGWMMEVPAENSASKAWSLTQTGERRVDEMTKPTASQTGVMP